MSRSILIELKTQGDLTRTTELVSWLSRPAVKAVVVQLPWLNSRDQEKSAKALLRLFNDCGCLWGGVAFLAALVGTLVTQVIGGVMSPSTLVVSVLIAMSIALVAKFLGLTWSRWRILVLLRRIGPPREPRPQSLLTKEWT